MVTVRHSDRLSIVLLILSWSFKHWEWPQALSLGLGKTVLIGHGLNCYAIELVSASLSLQIMFLSLTVKENASFLGHSLCLWYKLIKSLNKVLKFFLTKVLINVYEFWAAPKALLKQYVRNCRNWFLTLLLKAVSSQSSLLVQPYKRLTFLNP